MTMVKDIHRIGTRAAQTAYLQPQEGELWSVTDESYKLERYNGSAWVQWGPTPSGGGGAVVQVKNFQTGAVATGNVIIPLDDTIPQNTEGTEFMSLSITPTSATNKLKIDVVAVMAPSTAAWLMGALFQDSGVNALAAAHIYQNLGPGTVVLTFTHFMTAGTTSATTFKFRGGQEAAGTMTFNGYAGNRKMGGVMASSITITEVTP